MAAGGSHPPAAPAPGLLVVALAAGSACLAASAVACAVTCRLTLAKRRRRRAKPDGAASGGDGESAGGDGPRTAKTAADIRQSDSVNLTTVSSVVADGKLSSAEDVCSAVYGDEYDPTSAVVPAGAAYEAHDAGPAGGYDPHGPFRAHDAAATTLEANPDLISDASTVVRDAGGGGRDGEVYKIAVPPEFWSGGVPAAAAAAVFPSADAGYQLSSYNVSPRKSLAGDRGEPYPPDYGLPKMPARILQDGAMGYPPDYGLPKLRLYPPQPQPYRTLPHRRNAAKPQGRSCQEAEFVLLQQQHHHHHHHQNAHHHHRDLRPDRYEPQNVRHNQQGYPYAAAVDAACYTSPAAFYEPPSLSNASAQTLDEETMTAMMMLQPSAGSRQRSQPAASGAAPEQQHRAVTSVQKQSANTESPDEGYVGEGPDS